MNKIESFVLNNQIYCSKSIPSNMKKIIIYCHGFGESKERINQHFEILNKNDIGIISFDFPCHGEDLSNKFDFNLSSCINYFNRVIDYTRKYDVPISLMGSSFGGYIILSRIDRENEKFDKVFLKFPAVNFYECIIRKLNLNINYFEKYKLSNNIILTKDNLLEFKYNDLMKNFNKHDNDIYIIHGDKDKTVLLSDIELFCNKYKIALDIIKGAEHGMKDYLDTVNEKLLEYLNN